MPSAGDLKQHEGEVIDHWLAKVQTIRDQQTKLFDYLLASHPTDFTFLAQSCEDRTGHWLYPITPFNVGYNASVTAFARVLSRISTSPSIKCLARS